MAIVRGTFYEFKITARNAVGTSEYSTSISVIAATYPDAPLSLQNLAGLTTGYQIGVQWTEGLYNGGSPVLDYQVQVTDDLSG